MGNYASIISDFNTVTGKTVYVVDGESVITNPNEEFRLLLDFFKLDNSILKFEMNEETGFHCLQSPINYCLNGGGKFGKGTSRKTTRADKLKKFPQLNTIENAYRSQMRKTFEYVYNCNTDCCSLASNRFVWLKKYFC